VKARLRRAAAHLASVLRTTKANWCHDTYPTRAHRPA
jgi:hypothetical protein